MATIRSLIAAILLLVTVPRATLAQSQDLGHKILGVIGLDAATQPEAGLYVGNRVIFYHADELLDRNGDPVPVQGFDIKAGANVTGLSRVIKLDGALYFSASVAFPVAWLSLRADVPNVSIDRFGLGDMFVEPIRLGVRGPRVDVVTSFGLYIPTGQTRRLGIGQTQWSQQLSAGGTIFLDDQRGWRVSALASYDRYQNKVGIDIRRGDSVQVQGGFGGPLSRVIDVGLAGYALWQVRDDSGSDLPLILRGARDRVFGLGPEIAVTIPEIRSRLVVRYEWDLTAASRPKGQILVAGLSFVAWRPR